MTHSDNPTFPHFLTYDLSQSALHVEVFQDVNPSVFWAVVSNSLWIHMGTCDPFTYPTQCQPARLRWSIIIINILLCVFVLVSVSSLSQRLFSLGSGSQFFLTNMATVAAVVSIEIEIWEIHAFLLTRLRHLNGKAASQAPEKGFFGVCIKLHWRADKQSSGRSRSCRE